MKVLHLLRSNQFSGAENVACQIIGMMKKHSEYEMAYCSADGPVRDALEERQIPFVSLEKTTLREVRRAIKMWKPDIIHAHDMYASFVAACVCGNIRLISHIHNNSFDSRKPTLKAILYRLAAIKAKHIFWVSESARQGYCFYRGLEKKSSVLYNVIDVHQLEEKAGEAENQTKYDVVYLGRLTYPKHPERLISVLEQVIKEKPDVQAAIIGSGELEEEVHRLIRDNQLQGNIHCLGFMHNPYGILQNAKVMLMTSRWEGLPMCALEAQALGVPIVSTPTDGLKELLEEGKDGFLSEENQVLREQLVRIITNSGLQNDMSAYAHEKSKTINDEQAYCSQLLKRYGA